MLLAQRNPQPYFRNYSTEDGLPSPEVYCAFEDSGGYMWFGTDNGVARFDGYEFKTYGPEEGLMSNVVFDIFEDGKGRIWFGTMTGEIYILDKDAIIPYQYNNLLNQYEGQYRGAGLTHLTKDETAYISLLELGLLIIAKDGASELVTGKLLSSLLVYQDSNITNTQNNPTNKIKNKNFVKWESSMRMNLTRAIEVINGNHYYQKLLPNSPERRAGDAQFLPTGELLIQTGGFLHCLNDTNLIWSMPFEATIIEIIPDDKGAIWFCLKNKNGLRKYANLTYIKENIFEEYISDLSVSNIRYDSKGGFWVTTLGKGVFYTPNINLLHFNSKDFFSDEVILSVTFKDKNQLYVGCHNGDIYYTNLKNNQIEKFRYGHANSHNSSLLFDTTSNTLWGGGFYFIGNQKGYIPWYNPFIKKMSQFTKSGMDNLQLNSKGYLIGNVGFNGFHILDIERKKVIFNGGGELKEKRRRIYGLHSDHSDKVWVGLANGLFYFDFSDTTYVRPSISHPAFHHRVEDIDGMLDSTLVFGTKGFGVMFWKGDSILQVSDEDGLTSNMLEDVHVDENGVCWAGTLNGLNKITFDENGQAVVRAFTMSNGLPSNEIYQVESYEGQVWLCTAGGLVKFNERPENTDSPPPIIQRAIVNNSPIKLIDNQEFRHKNNNFEFNYHAINYRMDGRIPYRYRLHKNDEWQYTQNRSVNYPALPPSDYNFEIQAQNEDQYWSNSTTYSFSILPPWWQTWWARGAGLLALIGGVYYYQKSRAEKIRKEAAINEQIKDLEGSALQAQMNPHFIFNCLNSIQNFILKNDKKNAVEYLSKFARLVRHNLNASVNGTVNLQEEISILENYLALEQQRFDNKFNYEIHIDDFLKNENIEFPPLLIQPYVENAVLHGMSNEEEKGKIKIAFNTVNYFLAVTITDNGKGVNNKNKKRINHKSVGMGITKKRLELLDANNKNVVRITTLEDENKNTVGTAINILIKIKNSNN